MNYFFEHLLHEFELPLANPVLVFSLILFIILLSPILLRKLNIPGIIGLIISGVIIGPHGLNFLEKNSAIELFSTIGLLYIMFIAGLELDMNEFRANRNKSAVFGFLTFILPSAIGFPVCYYLLGYDFNASFLTASMFATHTLVAYPIVSKLGISKNQAVAVSVGGTILTDTAVLIILAVIMGNSQGTLDGQFWLRLGVSLSIFSVIMFFVIPRISKWFFRKLESENHAHYIYVLSVVFFAAFLAEVAGVEPIIGAFMAGLALNRLIPHSSALMNRIEFIGNSLFIPFFLISVGMLVEIQVILSGPGAIIIAVTLTAVALFGKWVAAFFTQKIFRYSKAQRQLIFGLSSAHAAATLAIVLVGYKAGIIDDNILNGTIILILFTCVVASFATERAAKKILLSDEKNGSEVRRSANYSEHLLIPYTEEVQMEKIMELGFLIKDPKSINPITLLSVIPNDEQAEANIMDSRKTLESFVHMGAATDVKVNPITTIDFNQANGISRISREIMSNILLLGWPQQGTIFDRIFGERMEAIVGNVDKTILICNLQKPFITHKRIVVVTPPFAERESGFEIWIRKIARISRELSIPVVHFGDEKNEAAMTKAISYWKLTTAITYRRFTDWEDFLVLTREFNDTDLFVLVTARKGAVSHIAKLDSIPAKMDKYFPEMNKILIYPQQNEYDNKHEQYEDFSNSPLTKGIETIEQIGKGIGNIFKKGKE